MQVYADVEFYQAKYLLGRNETIPIEEFGFWERKARERINRNKVELEEIPEYLSMATCEVAEEYYTASQASSLTAKKSESVSGYSVSYADQRQEDSKLEKSISRIIIRWITGSDLHNLLIFRGIG